MTPNLWMIAAFSMSELTGFKDENMETVDVCPLVISTTPETIDIIPKK